MLDLQKSRNNREGSIRAENLQEISITGRRVVAVSIQKQREGCVQKKPKLSNVVAGHGLAEKVLRLLDQDKPLLFELEVGSRNFAPVDVEISRQGRGAWKPLSGGELRRGNELSDLQPNLEIYRPMRSGVEDLDIHRMLLSRGEVRRNNAFGLTLLSSNTKLYSCDECVLASTGRKRGGEMEQLDEAHWNRRRAECRDTIATLAWMFGRWRGHGESPAGPRISDVETKAIFDGTFVESRERVYTARGELEHEDLTIYGAEPERGPGEMWAHLYIPGGIMTRYRVSVLGDNVVCEPEDFGARLSIARAGDGYRVRVFFPGEAGGWVEDSTLTYERAD
jgi:hypothetical protein